MWGATIPDCERASMHSLLMDLAETAALLKEHPRTVADHARTGEVPAARVGAQWRFWKPAVLRVVVGDLAAAQMAAEAPTDQDPELVTSNELADLLGISLATTLGLLQAGDIPAGKAGRGWRIYWPVIRDAIAQGRPLNSEKDS